jgi:hypothetical protein
MIESLAERSPDRGWTTPVARSGQEEKHPNDYVKWQTLRKSKIGYINEIGDDLDD